MLLRTKMRNRTANQSFADEDPEDRDYLRRIDKDIDIRPVHQKPNSNYRKAFKPHPSSLGKPQSEIVDESIRDVDRELNTIQANLQRKRQVLKVMNDRLIQDNSNNGQPGSRRVVFVNYPMHNNLVNNGYGYSLSPGRNFRSLQDEEEEYGSPGRTVKKPNYNITREHYSPGRAHATKRTPIRSRATDRNPDLHRTATYQDADNEESPRLSKKIIATSRLRDNHYSQPHQPEENNGYGNYQRNANYTNNKYTENVEDDNAYGGSNKPRVFTHITLRKVPRGGEETPEHDYSYSSPGKKPDSYKTGNNTKQYPQFINAKEEAPISLLKKSGRDIPEADVDPNLIECPEGCGRRFNQEALEKHVKVCKKVFLTKRKQYDSSAARKTDELLEFDPGRKPQSYKSSTNSKPQPSGGVPKWKAQSEALRAGLRAARGQTLSRSEQQALSLQSQALHDDLIPCPTCGRKFNEKAAERHIPFCANKDKLNAIKNGGGKSFGGKGTTYQNSYSRRY